MSQLKIVKENQTAEEMTQGCEHDGSYIPFNEVIRLMDQFAAQESAKAVAKRDEEIMKWVNTNYDEIDRYKSLSYQGLLQFLSTPTPTSAEIAQVEPSLSKISSKNYGDDGIGLTSEQISSLISNKPEKVSDNFRINIIPELTRKELEERCIELYERLHNPSEPSIPIREIEELRDDIEEINLRLDLVSDSELIQCYGSIIGRLNMMLQPKKK